MNRDVIALLESLILEQGVDADSKVELDEEEEDANFRNLQTEKHSDNSQNEREDQNENIHHQVGQEKVLRAL